MSYPPRPPHMGMPMMPPGYNYPPMGMMPMGMPMVPPVMPPNTVPPPPKPTKKPAAQDTTKDNKGEKPPVTTVFVGNISDRAPDPMIRQMLNRCGNVISWKRVQGASGKLQAFGFCEYEDPEATLRCIRLLNDWTIAEKKLVVKVDAKTKAQLEEWKGKKDSKNGEETSGADGDGTGEDEEEFSQREDRVAKAGLDAIMREYTKDLTKAPPPEMHKEEPVVMLPTLDKKKIMANDVIRDEGLDGVVEEEKKDIISREIGRFRDLHKDEEEDSSDKDATKRRQDREREREKRRLRELQEQERERREKQQREKDREKERQRRRSRTRSKSRTPRSRSRSRERERERERDSRTKAEKPKREREKRADDEEEDYERRKIERKLREKELTYQDRLKNWEARERKRARELEKEKEKEDDRQREETKEARRLKEFLEDYDDDRDDPKYYKGSALQRRLKEREKELELDGRDRQREREELEEIKRKLVEEGHPDVEAELAKIEREREEHMRPKQKEEPIEISDSPEADETAGEAGSSEDVKRPANMHPSLRPVDVAPSVSSRSQSPSSGRESPEGIIIPEPAKIEPSSDTGTVSSKIGVGDSPGDSRDSTSFKETGKRKKLTVGNVFNQDDDDVDGPKRRKLVPLDYTEDEKKAIALSKPPVTVEEKRKHIKNLIERIPTAKDDLFAFTLDWTMVDTVLMDRRIKPWVNKKIVEYIGEEEPTLTEFVCQKVMAHSTPEAILSDVAMVLDEEAEVFVVKMWRLLIYETEAKKLGLVK